MNNQKASTCKVKSSFQVFGEPVNVLLAGDATHGRVAVITQLSPPGGGPPPHVHTREDETFTVLHGDFEMFDGVDWHSLRTGETAFAERGKPHTFRSVGPEPGLIQVVCTPAGMDRYLEEISVLSMPQDYAELVRISEGYGITFLPPKHVANDGGTGVLRRTLETASPRGEE